VIYLFLLKVYHDGLAGLAEKGVRRMLTLQHQITCDNLLNLLMITQLEITGVGF